MSGLSPTTTLLPNLTLAQAQQQLTEQFAAVSTVSPNTDSRSAIQAIINTVALLFCQGQVTQNALASVTRLASSFGADVDSFVSPFGFARESATAATGTATFSIKSVAAQQIVVPVGLVVRTNDGIQFTVVVDQTQPAYSAAANGYVISVGQQSVNATVQCSALGTVGNAKAGTISLLYAAGGAAPPVDSVTNAQAFATAQDDETDAALKARFILGMSGSRGGTANAIAAAIAGVQEGLTYSIGDMLNVTGTGTAPETTVEGATAIPAVGVSANFTVANPNALPFLAYVAVYDGAQAFYGQITAIGPTTVTIKNIVTLVNGSGTIANGGSVLFVGGSGFFTAVVNVLGQNAGPSAALLAAVAVAIDNSRAAGISRSLIGPTLVDVNASGTLVLAPGADPNTVLTAAQSAFDAFVNNIGLDPAGAQTVCPYIDVGMTLRQVPGVKRVDGLQLNGTQADVTAGFAQQLVAGTFTFVTL